MADEKWFDELKKNVEEKSARDLYNELERLRSDIIKQPCLINSVELYSKLEFLRENIQRWLFIYKRDNALKSLSRKSNPTQWIKARKQLLEDYQYSLSQYEKDAVDFYINFLKLQKYITGLIGLKHEMIYVVREEGKAVLYQIPIEIDDLRDLVSFEFSMSDKGFYGSLKLSPSKVKQSASNFPKIDLIYKYEDALNQVYSYDVNKFEKGNYSKNKHLVLVKAFNKWHKYFIGNMGSMNQAYADFYLNKKVLIGTFSNKQYLFMQRVLSTDNMSGFFLEDVQYIKNGEKIEAAIKSGHAQLMGYTKVMDFFKKYLNTGIPPFSEFLKFFTGSPINKKKTEEIKENSINATINEERKQKWQISKFLISNGLKQKS